MVNMIRRYLVVIGGLVLAALIGGSVASIAWSDRGLPGPLVSMAERPVLAVVVLLLALLVLAVLSGVAGRIENAAVGMFLFGGGLTVLAMRFGTVRDLVFAPASIRGLGIETIVWSCLLVPAAVIVFRLAGPLPDMRPADPDRSPWNGALSGAAAVSLVVGLVAIPVAWLILRTDMKGQSIAAAIIAGLLCGLIGRLWHPRLQPVLLFAAPGLALGLVQIVLGWAPGPGAADRLVTESLPRLLFLMPVDVAGGSAIGVAMGLGWARSFLQEVDEERERVASSPASV